MRAVIFCSDDPEELSAFMASFHCGLPFNDAEGRRIGTVTRAWIDGNKVLADIECVEEDIAAYFTKRTT